MFKSHILNYRNKFIFDTSRIEWIQYFFRLHDSGHLISFGINDWKGRQTGTSWCRLFCRRNWLYSAQNYIFPMTINASHLLSFLSVSVSICIYDLSHVENIMIRIFFKGTFLSSTREKTSWCKYYVWYNQPYHMNATCRTCLS